MTNVRLLGSIATCAALLLGVCNAAGQSAQLRAVSNSKVAPLATMAGLPFPLPAQNANGKIQHVVIIMQENRGMDDLFQGFPGADTRNYNYNSLGQKITLVPVPLEASYDISHDIYDFEAAYDNGKMDGFDQEGIGCYQSCPSSPEYGYVPHNETKTYFDMGKQYVLADRMFTSHIDDSFISHQYIISGQANHSAYFPNSYWGCDGGPSDTIPTLMPNRQFGPSHVVCWDVTTLGDELDKARKSWRFYASSVNGDGGIWSAYQAIKHIRYGKDWTKDVINPDTQVLTDVQNGFLANMTWITPTCETSDHAGCGSNLGPAWVASIVNAIGQSKFWDSTAIFVIWDEWGGWSDHVPPPYVDYDGLGMRIPLLVISPYAKQGYVSHVQYEEGSLLRFAEDQFGLKRMTASDSRSNSPAVDAFDFTQSPRTFKPFASPYNADFFIHRKPDLRIPDTE